MPTPDDGVRVLFSAVLGLIAVALCCIGSGAYLLAHGKELPDGIIGIGSAAVGALATLMTTQRGGT